MLNGVCGLFRIVCLALIVVEGGGEKSVQCSLCSCVAALFVWSGFVNTVTCTKDIPQVLTTGLQPVHSAVCVLKGIFGRIWYFW